MLTYHRKAMNHFGTLLVTMKTYFLYYCDNDNYEGDDFTMMYPKYFKNNKLSYSLNPAQVNLAKKFVDKNLEKRYIDHFESPMAFLLFFIGKKDRSIESSTKGTLFHF